MAGRVDGWVSEDPERDWPLVSKHAASDRFVPGRAAGAGRAEEAGRCRCYLSERPRSATSGFLLAMPEEAAERVAPSVRGHARLRGLAGGVDGRDARGGGVAQRAHDCT